MVYITITVIKTNSTTAIKKSERQVQGEVGGPSGPASRSFLVAVVELVLITVIVM